MSGTELQSSAFTQPVGRGHGVSGSIALALVCQKLLYPADCLIMAQKYPTADTAPILISPNPLVNAMLVMDYVMEFFSPQSNVAITTIDLVALV